MRDAARHAKPLEQVGRSRVAPATLIGALALAVFGYDLASEPHFVDESAYLSQSYYVGLALGESRNDVGWLEYAACDLPPLPKYLIGAALCGSGYALPGPADARAWYETYRRFESEEALVAARRPFVVIGAIGCMAIYGLGVLLSGRAAGCLAALLLMVDPLYRMLSRRAMSDVPCEAFMLLGLFFALSAWRSLLSGGGGRTAWFQMSAAGVCAGLSIASKLSGTLTLMVIGAWGLLALLVRAGGLAKPSYFAAGLLAAMLALVVFVLLDPFLTAHPPRALPPHLARLDRMGLAERARFMRDLRLDVAVGQKERFAHNALNGPYDKVTTSAVQGFGRFGPLGPSHTDSTKRYDWTQDWGAVIWLPLVAAGCVWAWRRGLAQRSAGEPPTAWAVLVHFAVALGVVSTYVPLAWDRYFLPIQAPSILVASGAVAAVASRLIRVSAESV